MSRMIQIRHVPDELHRKLKARAALQSLSLSDYLLSEIREIAGTPSVPELMKRLARRTPVRLPGSAAEITRAGSPARRRP